jgi:hypothetical protein
MKRFSIVEFKKGGLVACTIGLVLKIFEPKWDFWGWHLAIVWSQGFSNQGEHGWYLLESIGRGVVLGFHTDRELVSQSRCHNWFDKVDEVKAKQFATDHLGKSYDVAIYFWTAFQYLVRHFWNRRIPRLLDDKYTCWELVSEFCDDQGKPICSKYDCPMITDILKQLGKPCQK